MFTVIETDDFGRAADKLLTEVEKGKLRAFVAEHPTQGVAIPGTGGIRKLRWAAKGRGKRGGARIIYFVQLERGLIYLLLAYSKSEQEDLTPNQRRELAAIVATL